MKKNILFYVITLVPFIISFFFLDNAYREMQRYSLLTERAVRVYGAFERLSKGMSQAAAVSPDLMRANKDNKIPLFDVDSAEIISNLEDLKSHVLDTLNAKLALELDRRIRSELHWLFQSDVPDSLLHRHSSRHLRELTRIDSIINLGINRTQYLFEYRTRRAQELMEHVQIRIAILVTIGFILLLFTLINLFQQLVKRRVQQEELINNEKRFRALVENSNDIIAMLDKDSRTFYESPATERITGYEHAHRVSGPSATHPDDIPELLACRNEVMTNPGKPVPITTRLKHKDGHYVWVEGTFTNLLDHPAIHAIIVNLRDISERKIAEQQLEQREKRFRETLENMIEGVQIIGYDWRYIYVNESLHDYSSYMREQMIGKDIFELYPGVEHTPLYAVLLRCMTERVSERLESEFVFPNGVKKHFELSIQPAPEGLFILSVNVTERKKGEAEITKLNRLYAFISAINQSIVHTEGTEALLKKACDIATEIGGFKLAWIEMLDSENKLQLQNASGDEDGIRQVKVRSGLPYSEIVARHSPVAKVLETGNYFVNNDLVNDPRLKAMKEDMLQNATRSGISLPIKIKGRTVGVFNLLSTQQNFFDEKEIALLEEATGDISFALDNIDRAKKHKETEELLALNEKRFRSLIEKSTDLKTLTNKDGVFIYASPSVSTIFGYNEAEFLNRPAYLFFHPDDIPDLLHNRNRILKTPGSSFPFEYRTRHKDGHRIWVEGTLTNMLHEPGVEALVSNFKDITDRKNAEAQLEFDRNNLDALINNTNDLLWSIDHNYDLITFNKPFYEIVKNYSGKEFKKGENIFSISLSEHQASWFRSQYEKALEGKTFTEIYTDESQQYFSEISFYPIFNGREVIGTACHSRDITDRKKTENEREKIIADLMQHSKNLEQFSYVVSHNLRAPIAHILGISNILKGDLSDSDRSKSQQFLYNAVDQLDMVVKDLNKILEVRAAISENRVSVDLREIIKGIMISIHDSIESENVSIETNFEAEHVYSIQSYIYSIFYNLIINSIKYRQPGRIPMIRIRSWNEDGKIRISFRDNGRGMDLAQYGDKVFGLYKRFHLNISGKGMGLFMTKTQVEALQGKITVNSQTGEGTEFLIELPDDNEQS